MAKQSITASTVAVTNIQSLPDVVVGDATNLKATFDKTGLDEKTYINTVLIPELNGDDGSKKIGHDSANLGSDNVADALEEVRLIAVQAQAGDILPNSITNTELGVDVKVGSLAGLTTAEKSSVVGAINEIDLNTSGLPQDISDLQTDLNIVRTAKTTTGSAVALAVDTDGTFDLTRNGNILTVIPNVTNTGSMTINVDGQGAKTIKKANDSGTLVNLEAGDIKINVPTQLVRDTVSDFFVYAPKGGSNIKSIQKLTLVTSSGAQINQAITSVDLSKSIVFGFKKTISGSSNADSWAFELTTQTNVQASRNTSVVTAQTLLIYVVEFNNVKSLQKGNVTFSTKNTNVTISAINQNKSLAFVSMLSDGTSASYDEYNIVPEITSATNLLLTTNTGASKTAKWQVIEFN